MRARPALGKPGADGHAPRPVVRERRTPMPPAKSIAVVGVGHRRCGKLPDYDAYELGLGGLKDAFADAGLKLEDIEGLIVNRIPVYQRFCEIAGLDPRYVSITRGQGRFPGICIATAC